MKTLGWRLLALLLVTTGTPAVRAQERDAAVPGDYFSLEGALELFKKSASPEDFERMLNEQDLKVNNLDLNGDGYTDYLRVIDRTDRTIHTFTIQAVISDREVQDVAVIELEKLANGKAVLQITGDEDVYGTETIIEPTEEVRINAGTSTTQTVVNVWTWPSVQYVYSPYYDVWVSPWGWYSRPVWWRTWRPVTYYYYSSWWHPYRPYYSRCHTHRVVYAHQIYRPYRSTSVIVTNRHRTQLTRYRTEHRDDVRRDRYTDNRDRNRNNYGDRDNERPTPRTRTRSDESDRRNRYEATENRGGATRQRSENRDVVTRDKPEVNRPASRDRSNVKSSDTKRRSGGTIKRSYGQRSAPETRQQRSHSSGGGSKNSQPSERSRRTR